MDVAGEGLGKQVGEASVACTWEELDGKPVQQVWLDIVVGNNPFEMVVGRLEVLEKAGKLEWVVVHHMVVAWVVLCTYSVEVVA